MKAIDKNISNLDQKVEQLAAEITTFRAGGDR